MDENLLQVESDRLELIRFKERYYKIKRFFKRGKA